MTMNTRNPVWVDAAQTMIDCEIEHPVYGWIPFTASPDDIEAHGREIFAELFNGPVAEYVPPPPPTEEELAAIARTKRIAELKQLLVDSDYKVLPDYDKDSEAIKPQRQAWRDEIRALEAPSNGVQA